MTPIRLSIGVSDCDRVRPLVDGTVKIDGVAPQFHVLPVQELFNRQLTDHIFDCCEFPVTSYIRTLENAARPYAAIPVFPSRHFRLACVFVNAKSGIRTPADLAGRKVGIPVFDMAAAVWLRGMFEDHYGLPRVAPIYVTGGLEQARAGDEHPQVYPPQFTIERADESLAALLARGEIDALYTARAPSTFRPGSDVVRLFDDARSADLDYFAKTAIFPQMHLVAVKRPIADAAPDLTAALFRGFAAAQAVARERIYDSAALSVMLPWLLEHLLETERLLGADYWATGLRANTTALDTICRYMHDDGLVKTRYAAADMFDDAMRRT